MDITYISQQNNNNSRTLIIKQFDGIVTYTTYTEKNCCSVMFMNLNCIKILLGILTDLSFNKCMSFSFTLVR